MNRLFVVLFVGLLLISNSYSRERVRVAVASNFLTALNALKQDFPIDYDLSISSGSTSKLYLQIMNGAPFDVFLAADQNSVNQLIKKHKAVVSSQFVYASGKLVLWGGMRSFDGDALRERLEELNFKRLAIANPKLAPYGVAAVQVLKAMDLYSNMEGRLIYGENVSQAFQFVSSGNTDFGFVAKSQIMNVRDSSSYWEVPAKLYQPLHQSAILLNRAKENSSAKHFLTMLKSEKVQLWLSSRFGYGSMKTVRQNSD